MVPGLEDIQREWVGKKDKVFEHTVSHGDTCLVIVKSRRETVLHATVRKQLYECQRYFTIGDQWTVSIDLRDIELEQALQWLQGQL